MLGFLFFGFLRNSAFFPDPCKIFRKRRYGRFGPDDGLYCIVNWCKLYPEWHHFPLKNVSNLLSA